MPVDAMLKSRPGMENVSGRRKRIASWVIERKFHTYKDIFNYNAAAAQVIKNEVDIPVIVVGGIRRIADIRHILDGGAADFVSMSRPLILEPDLVDKMRSGKSEEARCINCSICLMGISDRSLRCYYGKTPR